MTKPIDDSHSFQIIVSQHAARYSHWQVDDLYKLVFQAAMGCEHAVTDPGGALERLKSEADGLIRDSELPLAMPISPDHRLVRIGVGPYLTAGGDLAKLAAAFVQTAQTFRPSLDRMIQYWAWVEDMAAKGAISMALPMLQDYFAKRSSQRYPAVHHSASYRKRYGPAYRVVLKDLMAFPLSISRIPK